MMHAREIAKTPILRKIDLFLSSPHNRQRAYDELKAGTFQSLAELLLHTPHVLADPTNTWLKPSEIAEVKRAWYDDPTPGYWPEISGYPSKKDIVREGFRKALELSIEGKDPARGDLTGMGLPIVTYWICAGDDHFQSIVAISPHQISVFLLTPETPETEIDQVLTYPENIWLISKYADAAAVKQASGYKGPSDPMSWKTTHTAKDAHGEPILENGKPKIEVLVHAPLEEQYRRDGVFEIELHGEEMNAHV